MKELLFGDIKESDEVFYVGLENIEELKDDYYEIVFDGIKSDTIKFYKKSSLEESFEEIRSFLFSIEIHKNKYKEFKDFFRHEIFKSRWFSIRVSEKETRLPVSIIQDTNEDIPEKKYIVSIKQINNRNSINKILSKYFSWNNFVKSNKEEIFNILNSIYDKQLHFNHKLNVYNVGQGSLTAVTTQDNIPIFYFDLGGGFAWNKSTYPVTLNLCFSFVNTIIISHWDGDHLETARRYFATNSAQLKDITWIIPEQNITPLYFKFAAKMRATGRLILWPKTLTGNIKTWFGELIKCTGPDKNHSGLALIVDSPNNSIKKVLNPADAAYKYIPLIKKIQFDGLLATHHGANFDDKNSPLPKCVNGNIVYSHATTKYGHPKPSAVLAYDSCNWNNKLFTPDNHISFVTIDNNLNIGCGGNSCNLIISQTF
ncbi:hypothetical protein MQX03_07695 [Chryseobacterium aahli]|uniref:hypothetical protein n=1 Tax=Chryseobacterium aahli TaxID=1278643 RepID=UPI001F610421|nr:hypothetical protein [Chryseobacterium aahli]MCI3937078.1 hypothetical protein [Chryseobacterium aahli]